LSERLAAEKDFQDLSISVFSFFEKMQKSESGNLFKNLILRKTTENDAILFANKLGYSTLEELNLFFKNIVALKNHVQQRFPELISGDGDNKKEIESAAIKVLVAKGKPGHTTADCWVAWLAALTACSQYCALQETYYYDDCFWACSASVSSGAGLCFLLAD
jgi:hypothetical protein